MPAFSGATPRLALPYPIPDDPVDVPRDVKALADKLDAITALRPPVVTSLPAAPADGDEVYLRSGSGDVFPLWRLRYDASVTDAYKWRFVSGPPVRPTQSIPGSGSTANIDTWAAMPGSTPGYTPPAKGEYDVRISGTVQLPTATLGEARVTVALAGVAPAGDGVIDVISATQFMAATPSIDVRVLATTIGMFSLAAATNNVQFQFGNPTLWRMAITPHRLS